MKGKKFFLSYITSVLVIVLIISGAFSAKIEFINTDAKSKINISTKEILDSNQYINVNIQIPVIEGMPNKDMQDSLNQSFEKDAVDFKNEIENQAKIGYEDSKSGDYPFHTYEAYIEYNVSYMNDNILSIPITYYSYTGGAHGLTNIISKNINLVTGKEINLRDLFKEDVNYRNIIKQEVIRQIQLEPENYFKDAIITVENSNEEFPFYIEDGNIVVYYPLYSIAPYSSGIRKFNISLETFKDIINPEYELIKWYEKLFKLIVSVAQSM